MITSLFHAWERRLADVSKDRVVRPFDWGLDWIPRNGHGPDARAGDVVSDWVAGVMADTDRFYSAPALDAYTFASEPTGTGRLEFPSAVTTPHPENNTVRCRLFPARSVRLKPDPRPTIVGSDSRRTGPAVLVLPQWNADPGGHVGLCRLLAMNGLTALRLSLPYHDERMPPELTRADYIVSSNVARTVQVCRQAVVDARRAITWLAREGYGPIGILGTSLGSCLAMLTAAHEPLVRAAALNHISPHFADVVWRGLSTRHVREGLDGHIDLDRLRELWRPISPRHFVRRMRDRRTLLVYARYDLTFPVDLSKDLVAAFRAEHSPHEVAVLPCGHYSTGITPFKYLDGWVLTRFLKRELRQA